MQKKVQSVLRELKASVVQGDAVAAKRLAVVALTKDVAPYSLVSSVLTPAMSIVGQRFEERDFFVPDVLMAAEAMKAAMEVIEPRLEAVRSVRRTTVVIGVIRECSQEIGKDLVATMLRGAGFEVHDLGVNVPPDRFVDAAKELGADVIAVGSPMNHTTPYIKEITDRLEAEGLRGRINVLIGGAGTTPQTAKEVNADAWAKDALEAVKRVEELASR